MSSCINGLVSVVMPAYNCEEFIGEAIDSVLRQTYNHYEIIIINDGSTDGTEETILRLDSALITLINQPNKGVASARNTGIQQARGEFIAFLDSDDIWQNDTLTLQYEHLEKDQDIGLVYGDMELFDSTGILSENWLVEAGWPRPEGFIFKDLLFKCLFQTSTVMVRREVLDDVGLFDDSLLLGEDYDLWLRIAAKYKIGYIPKVITKYRRNAQSLTSSNTSPIPLEITVAEKALEREPEQAAKISRQIIRKGFSTRYFEEGYSAFVDGKYDIAKYRLLKSLSLVPWNFRTLFFLIGTYCSPGFLKYLINFRQR